MKNQKGITLVSLVITIIVMLILAGVALSMVMGDSSVLEQAIVATDETENQGEVERAKMAVLGSFDKSGKYDSEAAFDNIQKQYNLTEVTTTEAAGVTTVRGINSQSGEEIVLTHNSDGTIKVQTEDYTLDFDTKGNVKDNNQLAGGSASDEDLADASFVIRTKEDMKEFATRVRNGETFEGQIVKLGNNIDLGNEVFTPIGSYKAKTAFMGIFDGMGFTVSNFAQNTWALNNGYYYSDCGMGLFGLVKNATIKNVTISGAEISGEYGMCGAVSAVAQGTNIFENVTVSNSNIADYSYYAGGMIGWLAGTSTFNNCNIESTVTVAAQWGDFNNSTGGVIGGSSTSATIVMKNCNVAARIDGYNDVTSAYQWYAYRNCGMLIGNTGTSAQSNGTTYATAPNLTCENVTVTYGSWANYHYCKFSAEAYPFVRCEAGISNSAYSNPRYGHPTDKNGTEVVDDNHAHNDGEEHLMLLQFDQLYGGKNGNIYGQKEHAGVTVVYNNK